MVSRVRYESQPQLQARRNAVISKAHAKGLSLAEIATIANISPERVRQIVTVQKKLEGDYP